MLLSSLYVFFVWTCVNLVTVSATFESDMLGGSLCCYE